LGNIAITKLGEEKVEKIELISYYG
jgi:hypothetical protein